VYVEYVSPFFFSLFGKEKIYLVFVTNTTVQFLGGSAEIVHLKGLEVLNVSCNCIRQLPQQITDMQSLKELHVSKSGLKELPDNIGKLRNLRKLCVEYSAFFLKELPKSFFSLPSTCKVLFGISCEVGMNDKRIQEIRGQFGISHGQGPSVHFSKCSERADECLSYGGLLP